MKEYKEKVLKFLLQPENFEVVWELYDLIPKDRTALYRRLVNDTLQQLETHLKKELSGTYWEVKSFLYKTKEDPIINLFKKDWNGYFYIELGFEVIGSDYFGLVRDIDTYKFLKDNNEIEKIADEFLGEENGYERDEWYLGSKYVNDFTDIEVLKRLLLENRNTLIEEYIGILAGFAKEIEDKVPKLVEAARAISSKKK